jgi:Type I phosphodiesterase / nucleotide pyrophosphatase
VIVCWWFTPARAANISPAPKLRIFIVKVDGLNADLLFQTMDEVDRQSGKSKLPWITHVFRENGTVFRNFYTRGISLSAPSWSMLDTGRHTVIRGNVEYDRYTGYVYDYLNFFPFYIGNARTHQEDMPGVQVLDRAGIPLVIDSYAYPEVFQSFQLFQRGVHWGTLQGILGKNLLSKSLLSLVENGSGPSANELLADQTEKDLIAGMQTPEILYLDDYTGDLDHEGHATNQPAALLDRLQRLDALVGRIWTAMQATRVSSPAILVILSDHGMNNVPNVFSQGFSLPDLLNSPQGGGHHVVTNRYQLSDYRLKGLNPLVQRVITPSTASPYLSGESSRYPTAWLDLDGNERASLHLRNSDLNKIHILLLQLAGNQLTTIARRAATQGLLAIIERHRAEWTSERNELSAEIGGLEQAIQKRRNELQQQSKKWTKEQIARGERVQSRRLEDQLQDWQRERSSYRSYIDHVRALLTLKIDSAGPFAQKISDFVPELSLGDNNTLRQLQHYAVGLGAKGVVVDKYGALDEERSFRYVNYFSLLSEQHVRNNPQPALSPRPIDFVALCLPENAVTDARQAYWLSADEDNQLLVLVDGRGDIALRPILRLYQDASGAISFQSQAWRSGLPLHYFEDEKLRLPPGANRAEWLSAWHSESEWFRATHECLYSNAVIGITEQFSPVGDNVPGIPREPLLLLRYERRRRELVRPDLQIFASDHWNFNVRNFNPGGNHGAFFRISTHSVWMMAGPGIPVKTVDEPYDSLNFASTILKLAGKNVPMPDRVVDLQ